MPMKPGKGESREEFLDRCIPEMIDSGREQDQAVAACNQIWRDRDKGAPPRQMPEPDPGESHQDFIDRCVDEIDDEEACELAWDERRSDATIRKTHEGPPNGAEYVLSDESIDRMGDIITADGWRLDNFKKNPVALAFHRPDFVIGTWKNLRIEGGELRGHLELAPAGTSNRIDEIRRLVEAKILKATSVGFRPIKHEALDPEDPWGGTRFLEHELVETSLVSVPANPNALAVAKSLNLSPATLDLVFAKPGNRTETIRRAGHRAEPGKRHSNARSGQMSLNERIQEAQTKIGALKAQLDEHWQGVDDTNVSDAQIETANKLNTEIARLEKHHDSMLASEKLVAASAGSNGATVHRNGNGGAVAIYQAPAANGGRTFAAPASPPVIKLRTKKELDPIDLIVRGALIATYAKAWGKEPDVMRAALAEQRPEFDDELHKTMCNWVLRAASAPAMTTVTGWAAELVQQVWASPMETLFPKALFSRLAGRGLTLSFGTAGRINIPTRSRTPALAGSFVGEGMAIPVRQGAFTSQYLVPKKVAVISVWTREMSIHSSPAIESLIRDAIEQDTSIAIDSVLIDANAATAVRPAGLLNGVAAITATAGGGFASIVGDLKALTAALTTSTYGNVRNPVFLMNPGDINTAKLTVAPNTGTFPWKEELTGGTFNGYPVIDSGTVPSKTVILVDAADFVSVGGEAPRFELSDQATLHMEDTNPADLATGSPATVASPQRSLFQTDSIGLRMIMDLNWLMRRTGVVAWMQNVAW